MTTDRSKTLGLTWNNPDAKPPPPKKMKPVDILKTIGDPEKGMEFQDHRKGLKKYRDAFTGEQFMTFLSEGKYVADADAALSCGSNLISLGLVAMIGGTGFETDMEGDETLYHLTKQGREMIGHSMPGSSSSSSTIQDGPDVEEGQFLEDGMEGFLLHSMVLKKGSVLGKNPWLKTRMFLHPESIEWISWVENDYLNLRHVTTCARLSNEISTSKPNVMVVNTSNKKQIIVSFETSEEMNKWMSEIKRLAG